MLQRQRRLNFSTVAFTVATTLLFGSQCVMAKDVRKVDLETTKKIVVRVTGESVCLGCALKKEKGAKAQCSVFGHKHVLKVTTASADGNSLPIKGWVLHYLETKNSQELITKPHEKPVTISGVLYPAERVLEVIEIIKVTTPKPEHPKRTDHPKSKKSEHPEHPQ